MTVFELFLSRRILCLKFKKSFDKIISRPAPGLGLRLRSDKIIFLNYKRRPTTALTMTKNKNYAKNTMKEAVKKKQSNII